MSSVTLNATFVAFERVQKSTGLRERVSAMILAVATILVTISILPLSTIELLRRRSERLRGMSPQ